MNKAELAPYEVKYSKGIIRYLDGIVLKEREKDVSKEV